MGLWEVCLLKRFTSNRRVLTARNNVFPYGMSVMTWEKDITCSSSLFNDTVTHLFSSNILAIRFHTFPFDEQQCIYPAVISTYILFYSCSQIIIKIKAYKEKTFKTYSSCMAPRSHWRYRYIPMSTREWPWMLRVVKEELKRQWCNDKKGLLRIK